MLWLVVCSSSILPLQVGFLFCFFLCLLFCFQLMTKNTFSYNSGIFTTGLTICGTRKLCPAILEWFFVFFPPKPFFNNLLCFSFFCCLFFSSVFPFNIPRSTPFEITLSFCFFALSLLPLFFLHWCFFASNKFPDIPFWNPTRFHFWWFGSSLLHSWMILFSGLVFPSFLFFLLVFVFFVVVVVTCVFTFGVSLLRFSFCSFLFCFGCVCCLV